MMGNIQIQLQELSEEQLNKLKSYLSAQGRNLESIIESHLSFLLKGLESKLSDVGNCPNCFVNQKKTHELKGLPMLEAEKLGFVKIGDEDSRNFFEKSETFFVLCTECGWWGWPDKSHIESWKKWR